VACTDKTLLVHAYLDGELDLVRSLELEEHLKACEGCAQELRSQHTLRNSLRTSNLYDSAPQGLQEKIRASLPHTAEAAVSKDALLDRPRDASPGDRAKKASASWAMGRLWQWSAVAAAILAAVILGLRYGPDIAMSRQSEVLSEELIASHIRSLQPGHLMDVQSTDQHTVKPWFAGRLDFSPAVRDLTEKDFPLLGGRLDYLGHRNVAAIVYQRRKHIISVFIWPAGAGARVPGSFSEEGYNALCWTQAQMNFCAVSDVNSADLRQLEQLLR
jgi:anti-sigma factor RsiW